MTFYVVFYLCSTLLASVAQVVLKKSANKSYDVWWREYMNVRVIGAYFLFFGSTWFTVYALRYVPLSFGNMLGASSYIFITILSYFFLGEKIGIKRAMGLVLIIAGIIIAGVC